MAGDWWTPLTGSYLRLLQSCITHLTAQGPSRTCDESKGPRREELTGPRRGRAGCHRATVVVHLSCHKLPGIGGGLVFKAHRLVYHSTLGLRVIKKKKDWWTLTGPRRARAGCHRATAAARNPAFPARALSGQTYGLGFRVPARAPSGRLTGRGARNASPAPGAASRIKLTNFYKSILIVFARLRAPGLLHRAGIPLAPLIILLVDLTL